MGAISTGEGRCVATRGCKTLVLAILCGRQTAKDQKKPNPVTRSRHGSSLWLV
jgi:hypothetical protein